MRPSLAFCPLFIMRIPISLPCPTVSAVCEFFTNDETEGIKGPVKIYPCLKERPDVLEVLKKSDRKMKYMESCKQKSIAEMKKVPQNLHS